MIYRAHYLLTEYFIQFFAYHLTWRNQKGKKTENPVMDTLFTKFLILHLTIVSCFICTSKSKVKLQMSKPPGILKVWDDFHFHFQANITMFTSVRAAWKIGAVLQNVRSADLCGISCLELGRGVCDAIQYDRSDAHYMELSNYPNCE